jgi:predicted nucleic acid-binding protein
VKLAISDACIFIDLLELELIPLFFEQDFEIHTSVNVMNELNVAQNEILQPYKIAGKLSVHNILEAERLVIDKANYPASLSLSDKTVLFLAEKHDAIILSSDKTVRHNAKIRSIEYHGMLWILDTLLEKSLLTKDIAITKLRFMLSHNLIYQNNKELMNEINKRIKNWS